MVVLECVKFCVVFFIIVIVFVLVFKFDKCKDVIDV